MRDTGSDRGTAPDDGLTAAQRVVGKRLGETTRPLGEVVGAFVGEFGGVARDHFESAATLLEAVAPLPTPVEPEPVEPEARLPLFDLA